MFYAMIVMLFILAYLAGAPKELLPFGLLMCYWIITLDDQNKH